jgi:GxxExxY protein
MEENEISKLILDAAIAVHTELGGPGLLESYYENALKYELELRGLKVQTQMLVPVMYKGRVIGDPYRLDMLVEDKVIVECKATEKNNPIFAAQVNTYLHLLNCRLGIVINFGQNRIIDGWVRVANNMPQ